MTEIRPGHSEMDVNKLIQELATYLRRWISNERIQHDAIQVLTNLQGYIIVLEEEFEELQLETEEYRRAAL